MRALDLDGVIADLAHQPRLGAEIVADLSQPAAAPQFAPLPAELPEALRIALESRGVTRLWSHQAEALGHLAAGRDVLLTTPTASGKSLAFQLPVLAEALRGGARRALFLFPLKALGQDQRAKFVELAAASGLPEPEASVAIYDGDTPAAERARLRRQPPRVLITNPDMLHLGLLPHWPAWEPFLRDLGWLVLDELHVYRGIFGCHVHHVLARLSRVTAGLGVRAQWIAASATAGNARDFATDLLGRAPAVVEHSGAPRPGRRLLLLQPQASPYTTALQLLRHLLAAGLRTIVFTKARRITELLYAWLREQDPALAKRVASYRAGFLPEERREIERRLFSGELAGVISTSALELGIDVGGLDACLLVGFPGSVMATWQRAGRVGRGESPALVAMVALPDALDQYLLARPQEFLGRPCEELAFDPGNEAIAAPHLLCAAAERPLEPDRESGYLGRHAALLGGLLAAHDLAREENSPRLHLHRRAPHRTIGLRGSGREFTIAQAESGRRLGTIDGVRVFHECHPGAIYLHAGRSWAVTELAIDERLVRVIPSDSELYTSALAEKETEVRELFLERAAGGLAWALGRLEVRERVVGFERRRLFGQEVVDQHPLSLPEVTFEAHGIWWVVPRALEQEFASAGRPLLGALHALEHAAIGLLPRLALCDRNDLGGISTSLHPQLDRPAVFVYEGHPGGVGLAAKAYERLPELLARVRELLERCPCGDGCPSCIQSPKCGNGNRPLDKAGALSVLEWLLDPDGRAESCRPSSPRQGEPSIEEAEPEVGGSAPAMAHRAPSAGPRTAPRGAAQEPRTMLFDVETLRSAEEVGGWDRAHRMGVAVAVVCHLEEGRLESFRESEVGRLVETLRRATLVVGFNSRRFDYRVLAGYVGEDLSRTLPTLDLLDEVRAKLGFRLSLDHLAKETLGAAKSADGLQSLAWVRENRFDLVEAYCRKDVEILRDLYLFGRREGFLRYRDRAGRLLQLPVDW